MAAQGKAAQERAAQGNMMGGSWAHYRWPHYLLLSFYWCGASASRGCSSMWPPTSTLIPSPPHHTPLLVSLSLCHDHEDSCAGHTLLLDFFLHKLCNEKF